MKDSVAVILLAHNTLEWVQKAVQSIRDYNDVARCNLVIVDNASEDGLKEWAGTQSDFTYVYMDEGLTGCGKLLNGVKNALELTDDILIMEARFLITPHCLSNLLTALYEDDKIAAVGGISNGFTHNQACPEGMETYDRMLRDSSPSQEESLPAMSLEHQAVLFRASSLEAIGGFEDSFFTQCYTMSDATLRLVQKGYELRICPNAYLYDLAPDDYFPEDLWSGYLDDGDVMEKRHGLHYAGFQYRDQLIKRIDVSEKARIRVLEIGCDCGATLFEIKRRFKNAEVFGTELCAEAVRIANYFVPVVQNNIEEETLEYPKHSFDYIIFGDVLEHLHDPQRTLEYIAEFLKDGGKLIASVPNLMHISVMQQLLHGDFTYTETGLLDKTHIHFFTYNEVVKLFYKAGFKVEDIGSTIVPIEKKEEHLIDKLVALDDNAERFMYEAFQYVLRAHRM